MAPRKQPQIVEILGVKLPKNLLTPMSVSKPKPRSGVLLSPALLNEEQAEYQKLVFQAKSKRFHDIIEYVLAKYSGLSPRDDTIKGFMLFDILNNFSPGMAVPEKTAGRDLEWDFSKYLQLAASLRVAHLEETVHNDKTAVIYIIENFEPWHGIWEDTLRTRISRPDFKKYKRLVDDAVRDRQHIDNITEEEAVLELQEMIPGLKSKY
ncbi:MAG: hypothetical protein AAGF25_06315 [Pseudomonadota bacterium]